MLERLHWFGIRLVKLFEDTIKAIQESQAKKALRYTRDYRLSKYIESKGCKEISCVEHWIREFEKKESQHGYL